MSIDGVFVHHLVNELKKQTLGSRIQKIHCIRNSDFVMQLSNKKALYFALGDTYPNVRITSLQFQKEFNPSSFVMLLRKYLERGQILDLYQHQNDRVIFIKVLQKDELGYEQIRYIVVELITRYTNLFVLDEDTKIIDVLKKTSIDSKRVLLPKMPYPYLETDAPNPFALVASAKYQGVGKLISREIEAFSLENVMTREVAPTRFISETKDLFYCFDLKTIQLEKKSYPTLSDLLEDYFLEQSSSALEETYKKGILGFLNQQKRKAIKKKEKQEKEYDIAKENLIYEELGNLLSSNLYKLKKGDTQVVVENFYKGNESITLTLDPLLSPSKNLQKYFEKYKKAARSVDQIKAQILETTKEIQYLETLLHQVIIGNDLDIQEIKEELGYKVTTSKKPKRKKTPSYIQIETPDALIYIGKNNLQNNYLTHTLAKREDYFFHIKDYPGSHTIVKSSNLQNHTIYLAAMLCAYYSKMGVNTKLNVDYTKVKFVHRIKGQPGSMVTYTNFSTVTVEIDMEILQKYI